MTSIGASRDGAHSFDAPGAEFTHRYDQCTFEVLIDAFNLAGDLALVRLARIVHAADIAADLASDPLGLGLLAIGEGGLDVEADDQRLLDRGMFVYDACMPVEGSPQDGGLGMRRRPADTEAKMSHRADANGGNGLHRHRHLGGRPPRAGRVLDTLDSQHAVQLRAATLLRLSEHLQAPERGGRLMITVDGLTPLPTTELDDYLVVCKEFPDAGAALGRHLAWELGSDDATAVLSRAEAWIGERLRNQPAPGRMRDLAAALAVMVREGGGCRWPSGTTSGRIENRR